MKKFLISLLSIIFIISMYTNVYAATASINSGASADTVFKGKTFTVTLAGISDSPIDGMYTKFSYDKEVLSLESSVPAENYGSHSNETEIAIECNLEKSPNSGTLYVMTFKVLETANVEETTIAFSESELHLNVGETLEAKSTEIQDVTISIKTDDTTIGGNPDNNNGEQNSSNDSGNTNTGNSSNSDDGDEEKKENVSSNKTENTSKNTNKNTNKNKNTAKLPQTGAESTVLFGIVALVIVTIISYISYRKYNNI